MFLLIYLSHFPFSLSLSAIYELIVRSKINLYVILCTALMSFLSSSEISWLSPHFLFLFLCLSILTSVSFSLSSVLLYNECCCDGIPRTQAYFEQGWEEDGYNCTACAENAMPSPNVFLLVVNSDFLLFVVQGLSLYLEVFGVHLEE